jgi:hypothetical protein
MEWCRQQRQQQERCKFHITTTPSQRSTTNTCSRSCAENSSNTRATTMQHCYDDHVLAVQCVLDALTNDHTIQNETQDQEWKYMNKYDTPIFPLSSSPADAKTSTMTTTTTTTPAIRRTTIANFNSSRNVSPGARYTHRGPLTLTVQEFNSSNNHVITILLQDALERAHIAVIILAAFVQHHDNDEEEDRDDSNNNNNIRSRQTSTTTRHSNNSSSNSKYHHHHHHQSNNNDDANYEQAIWILRQCFQKIIDMFNTNTDVVQHHASSSIPNSTGSPSSNNPAMKLSIPPTSTIINTTAPLLSSSSSSDTLPSVQSDNYRTLPTNESTNRHETVHPPKMNAAINVHDNIHTTNDCNSNIIAPSNPQSLSFPIPSQSTVSSTPNIRPVVVYYSVTIFIPNWILYSTIGILVGPPTQWLLRQGTK